MRAEGADHSMINLSVQQVLSLWAHGTVLRNLTGNARGGGSGGGPTLHGCSGRPQTRPGAGRWSTRESRQCPEWITVHVSVINYPPTSRCARALTHTFLQFILFLFFLPWFSLAFLLTDLKPFAILILPAHCDRSGPTIHFFICRERDD